jgi:hypothetical protein
VGGLQGVPTAATERGALGPCAEAALEEHSEDAGNLMRVVKERVHNMGTGMQTNRHGGSSFRICRVAWLQLWFPLVTIN